MLMVPLSSHDSTLLAVTVLSLVVIELVLVLEGGASLEQWLYRQRGSIIELYIQYNILVYAVYSTLDCRCYKTHRYNRGLESRELQWLVCVLCVGECEEGGQCECVWGDSTHHTCTVYSTPSSNWLPSNSAPEANPPSTHNFILLSR